METGKNYLGKKVLVRGDRSGVFIGELVARNGQEVELKNAQNIRFWSGACGTIELSKSGVQNKDRTDITVVVDSLVLLDAIQISMLTQEAIDNLASIKHWSVENE